MFRITLNVLIWWALLDNCCWSPAAGGAVPGSLDKSWTTAYSENEVGSQPLVSQAVASRVSSEAEGMGFEPTTPCGAPDFESGRWPVRLPS